MTPRLFGRCTLHDEVIADGDLLVLPASQVPSGDGYVQIPDA